MKTFLIKWVSYPLILGVIIGTQLLILANELPYWPLSPIVVAVCIFAVAVLERLQPYQDQWNNDHNDTVVDVMHAAFSLSIIFLSIEIAALTREFLPIMTSWPSDAPIWIQIAIAGLIIDFGLWFMHWLSHKSNFLWCLHTLHHSSKRLYWLNGERRHPLSALLLASPGMLATILLGAPPEIIGAWFAIVAVHLAFQHANLDYTVGVFRNILGVAEVHRWHHKRDYQDAQVNYGEFWMIWDQIFRTFRSGRNGVISGEVGINEAMPYGYIDQLTWPFTKTSQDLVSITDEKS